GFDARTAKMLQAGEHIVIDGSPGLRLEATKSRRTWTYRFKSPIDGRMRQTKIGEWPAMSAAAATAQWEILRAMRDSGRDPAIEKRGEHQSRTSMVPQGGVYTVSRLCADYLAGHVERHRKTKSAREVQWLFANRL